MATKEALPSKIKIVEGVIEMEKKILEVVEMEFRQKSISEVLSHGGYNNVAASFDGQDALEKLGSGDYALAIVEIESKQPEMDGKVLSSKAREMGIKTKFLFMSDFEGSPLRNVIVKPFSSIYALLERVEELLKD